MQGGGDSSLRGGLLKAGVGVGGFISHVSDWFQTWFRGSDAFEESRKSGTSRKGTGLVCKHVQKDPSDPKLARSKLVQKALNQI